jgi:hypothetical protein
MQEGVRASLVSKCVDNLMRALSLFERVNGVELTLEEIANVVSILLVKEFEQRVMPEGVAEKVLGVSSYYREGDETVWAVHREARMHS